MMARKLISSGARFETESRILTSCRGWLPENGLALLKVFSSRQDIVGLSDPRMLIEIEVTARRADR